MPVAPVSLYMMLGVGPGSVKQRRAYQNLLQEGPGGLNALVKKGKLCVCVCVTVCDCV